MTTQHPDSTARDDLRRPLAAPWAFRCGLFAALAVLALSAATAAQGRRPAQHRPQVRATVAKIDVQVRERAATVELVQTLHNDGRRPAEATWMLPLPADASVDRFQMVVGGEVLEGEVLKAGQAREIYERIVRQRRDPGLLEYIDQGMLRARVFPIPPQGDVEVRVRYRQLLDRTGSLSRFTFPLRALGVGGRPAERVGFQFELESQTAIKTIYSPIDGLDVIREGDHSAKASLELTGQRPSRDLDLFFGVDDKAFGLDLLAHRDGDKGHFLMMLTPQNDWPDREGTTRVIQFVLDTSGSMKGKKIEQAKNALRRFVDSLRPGDRFDIVTFSTAANSFFGGPVKAEPKTLDEARKRIDKISARGGTNIEEALQVAFSKTLPSDLIGNDAALPIVVFLTDGLPTVGVTGIDPLMLQASESNTHDARFFTFGVGFDVNTRLLDDLALTNRGDSSYVRPDEDIEIQTSALFDKISHPVLTDLEIHFDGVQVSALEPRRLRDLFKGSSLNLLGAYEGSGPHAIRVCGKVQGQPREFVYEATFPARSTEHDYVPVLWAKRRVAFLLEAIRSNGSNQELVDEIKQLSKEYGLVTPFTSSLILEDEMQLADQLGIQTRRRRPAGDTLSESDEFFRGAGPSTGERAVTASERLRRLKEAKSGAGRERDRKIYRGPGDNAPPNPGGGGMRGRPQTAGAPRTPGATGPSSPSPSGPTTRGGVPAVVGNRPQGEGTPAAERIGKRTFVLVGEVWVDRSYDKEKKLPRKEVVAFSKEYFALLKSNPELKRIFALGKRVIVVLDGTVYALVEKKTEPIPEAGKESKKTDAKPATQPGKTGG